MTTIAQMLADLTSAAKTETEKPLKDFEKAMDLAEAALIEIQQMGLEVSIKHPMQARQTFRSTRLVVATPRIAVN